MTPQMIKRKVLREIELIPEDRLPDVYLFIHEFRLGLEKSHTRNRKMLLSFAGCWKDMPDEVFDEFAAELGERRSQAFSERRRRESFPG